MARFARIDSQIRANRLILANRFRVPELSPFFANRASGGLKIANRRFEAIRANRSHVMKRGFFFLRIDSCESLRFALRIARPSKLLDTKIRRMSETPTTTTSQKSIAVCTPPVCIAIRLQFVSQYASHLHRSAFAKILVLDKLWSPGCSPKNIGKPPRRQGLSSLPQT